MRKRAFKIFKAILILLLFSTTVITIAILWPLPKIEVPKNHHTILIKSVNVIDVQSGKIWNNQDVFIEGNRIKAIDSTGTLKTNPSSFVINAKGKYLIPGLWDMHSHSTQHSEWLHHPLYIANGVTGIRDMSGQLNKKDSYWAGIKEREQWNKDLNKNSRVTPRYILQSSYQVDGKSSVPNGFPEFFKLQKEEDIEPFLNFHKSEGVDFIKIYTDIPPISYRKLASEAPKYGIHLAGHKPIFLTLREAITLGQRSFEHGRIFMFECFPKAEELRVSDNWKSIYSKSKKSMVQDFDTVKALQLMDLMQVKNAYWTPTLQTLKSDAFAHEEAFLDNPNLKYVPLLKRALWWNPGISNAAKANLSPEKKGVNLDFYRASQKQVKMAITRSVPIMAGTDVTDVYVFAGFSLHTELKDLTESGLSNLEALQTATIVPAKFAELENEYGTVDIGKIADLVILNKNPLENIENTITINSVLMNGIYYDNEKLDELKKFTVSIASSFHMNVKAVYSLINSPLIRVQLAD